jgi:hypothetical protein
LFQAEVAHALCGGSPRAAERRFGWGRDCVETGLHEAGSGLRCVENFAAKAPPLAKSKTLNWRPTSAPWSSRTPKPTRS